MMDLEFLRDRRVMYAAAGGLLALLAGLGIGIGLLARSHPPAAAPEPQSAAPGSLSVEMGKEDPGLDPARPLRCFVDGQFVGMVTLTECAKKNGVATGSLDVGLDPSGEIAAAASDSTVLQPLPQAPTPPPPAAAVTEAAPPAPAAAPEQPAVRASGPGSACWRFSGDWRKISEDTSLDACVQALFAGRCERPGAASYGRWGEDTLRLVTGKVERSSDNRSFRTLVRQPPGDCSIPRAGD